MGTPHRVLKAAVLAAAVALLLGWSGGPPPAGAVFNDSDGDSVIDLAEEVTGSDPNDAASTPEDVGGEFIGGQPICSDQQDNDLDGLTDLDDPGCYDSDGDIVSDVSEQILGSDPNSTASFPEDSRFDVVLNYFGLPLFTCGDSADNDGDGRIDAADAGCAPIGGDGDEFDDALEKRYGSDPTDPNSVPEHEQVNPGSCSDGIDNDRDGLTDGDDAGCGVPNNDNRADAIEITDVPFADGPAIIKNASREVEEPQETCGYLDGGPTVWYRFTAPTDALLIADTLGSDFDTLLAVWRDNGSRLVEVACSDNFGPNQQSRAAFHASAGETYLFQVSRYPFASPMPSLTFHLTEGIAPANDNFLAARDLDALPFSETFDTSGASLEPGEPSPSCAYEPQGTVWYRFAPAAEAILIAHTDGSDFPTFVAGWEQTAFGLSEIECGGGFPSDEPRVTIRAQAGHTYFVQTGGGPFGTPIGQLTFAAELGAAPGNDDFAGATAVGELPFADSVDTSTADIEPDEPHPACLSFAGPAATVWYAYTATDDGLLVADTSGSDLEYNFVAAYRGGALTELEQLGCGVSLSIGGGATAGFEDTGARVSIRALEGATYYFQTGGLAFEDGIGDGAGAVPRTYAADSGAAGFADSGGLIDFHLTAGVPVANDDFANATAIASLPSTTLVDVTGASLEAGEPAGCNGMASTVWFSYTAHADEVLLAHTTGSSYETTVAAYTGESLDTLDSVGCNGSSPTSDVRFTAHAGVTYRFQIGSLSGQTGTLLFSLASLGPPPRCLAGGNRDFEVGFVDSSEIPCWTVVDQADGIGGWCLQQGTAAPAGPCEGLIGPAPAPARGAQAAMTNQGGPGSHVLYQCFEVPIEAPTAKASFQAYIDNYAEEFASPSTLDFTVEPNQQFRADLLRPEALEADPFTVAPGDILRNIIWTTPGRSYGEGYQLFDVSLTDFLGERVCLRFAEVDNQSNFLIGIDDVRVRAGTPGDANCDRRATAIDAALVLQYSARLVIGLLCPNGADTNADGVIDSLDAALDLQYEAGIIAILGP